MGRRVWLFCSRTVWLSCSRTVWLFCNRAVWLSCGLPVRSETEAGLVALQSGCLAVVRSGCQRSTVVCLPSSVFCQGSAVSRELWNLVFVIWKLTADGSPFSTESGPQSSVFCLLSAVTLWDLVHDIRKLAFN